MSESVEFPEAAPPAIRILLVDHQRICREGVCRLLETRPDFSIVGEAGGAFEGQRLVKELRPDVALLDPSLADVPGADAVRVVIGETQCCRVLLLTEAMDRNELIHALQLGARGLVLKDSPPEMLFRAIRSVMAGEYWIGHSSIADLVSASRSLFSPIQQAPSNGYGLTPRELQIIASVVAACPNREIAQALGISERTVKHHLTNVYDKIGVSNRLELALFALHRGLPLPRVEPSSSDVSVHIN